MVTCFFSNRSLYFVHQTLTHHTPGSSQVLGVRAYNSPHIKPFYEERSYSYFANLKDALPFLESQCQDMGGWIRPTLSPKRTVVFLPPEATSLSTQLLFEVVKDERGANMVKLSPHNHTFHFGEGSQWTLDPNALSSPPFWLRPWPLPPSWDPSGLLDHLTLDPKGRTLISRDTIVGGTGLGDVGVYLDRAPTVELVTPPLAVNDHTFSTLKTLFHGLSQGGFFGMEGYHRPGGGPLGTHVNVEVLPTDDLRGIASLLSEWFHNRQAIYQEFTPHKQRQEFFGMHRTETFWENDRNGAPTELDFLVACEKRRRTSYMAKYSDVNIANCTRHFMGLAFALEYNSFNDDEGETGRPALEFRIFNSDFTPQGFQKLQKAIPFVMALVEKHLGQKVIKK